MHPPGATVSGYILLFIIQIVFLILFAVLTDYDDELLPKNSTKVATSAYQLEREDEPENDVPEKFIIPKYSRKDWFLIYKKIIKYLQHNCISS